MVPYVNVELVINSNFNQNIIYILCSSGLRLDISSVYLNFVNKNIIKNEKTILYDD